MPQGSILGPILFLLYINDLPLNVSESNIVLFADDTNILISGENSNTVQSKLNGVMKDMQTWFTLNSLIINAEKTLVISFHTTQNKKPALPHVVFEGRGIPYNTDTKFLDVYISENVKWINHIKYVSSKLNTSLYMISSLKNVTSTRFKNHVFCMFSHPSEIWCDPVGR